MIWYSGVSWMIKLDYKGTLTIFYGWRSRRRAENRSDKKKNLINQLLFYFLLRHAMKLSSNHARWALMHHFLCVSKNQTRKNSYLNSLWSQYVHMEFKKKQVGSHKRQVAFFQGKNLLKTPKNQWNLWYYPFIFFFPLTLTCRHISFFIFFSLRQAWKTLVGIRQP